MANTLCLIIQLWQQLYHTPYICTLFEDGQYLVFNYTTILYTSVPSLKMANTLCLTIQLWQQHYHTPSICTQL